MNNIVLISKEILRRSFLGCYGASPRFKTPNIDRMASEGTLYENYYTAAPSTAMAMTSMFSGLYPHELDRKAYTEVEQFSQEKTLFTEFIDLGYETHVVWMQDNWEMAWKYSKVFDERTEVHGLTGVVSHVRDSLSKDNPNDSKTSMKYYEKVAELVSGSDKPVFIWVHFAHALNPSEGWGQDIGLFDDVVGKIMDNVDAELYLQADHGTALGEKNRFGYGWNVYQGSIHIPFITPNHSGQKKILHNVSSTQLKDIILKKTVSKKEYIYSDTQYYTQPNRKLTIIKDNYKYIYNKREKSEELYDLITDYDERHNLLVPEIYNPERWLAYPYENVYFYERWENAEHAYYELKAEKDRIWREGKWFGFENKLINMKETFNRLTNEVKQRGPFRFLKSLFLRNVFFAYRKVVYLDQPTIVGRWGSQKARITNTRKD